MTAPLRTARTARRGTRRRGAILVLMTTMSVAMLTLAALVINVSFLELTNTELRACTDAAAKAALITLSETQSMDDARAAARWACDNNLVAGEAVQLRDSEIEFGYGSKQGNGTYTFTPGVEPTNSVRVNAQRTDGSISGGVPTFLSGFLALDRFQASQVSTATRVDHDILVVLDRSGSMAWDMSGVEFQYPDSADVGSVLQGYFSPPFNPGSRWAALVDALDIFRVVVNQRDLNAQIGLVSFASDYTFGHFSSTRVSTDLGLTLDTSAFLSSANLVGSKPIIGDTNIAAGIDAATLALTDPVVSRLTANRTMVVFTDGVRTEGIDPVIAAASAAAERITIYTVTFGDGADQLSMIDVADIGQGEHYHATDAASLEAAFRAIAEQLPAVLTE
ncbi:MAG: vWA domain-containing protein [Planctomycetota bacterium]